MLFKQEVFKSIAYGCRICRGRAIINSGAGQVVLADLLPAAPVIRRGWCPGWGEWASDGDASWDGGGWRFIGVILAQR